MAENTPKKAPRRDVEPEVTAADWLFQESDKKSKSQSHRPTVAADPEDVFALADPSSVEIPTSLSPGVAPKVRAPAGIVDDQSKLDPAALVEEVWSRPGEWGGTLIVMGAWLTVVFLGFFFCWFQDLYGTAFLVLLAGGLVATILSYPLVITLERPVRITPEQAVRDYYGALAHHIPHYRRMWLLLSKAGRISTAYGSFEGFKSYWSDRLRRLREGHAGSLTPLVFEVEDFTADKSAGKVRIDAEFRLKVSVRGKRKAGSILSFPMKIALVRGPDKMWYLETGTMPLSSSM
ncbi:MAG TPA: hypothetical protein VKA15_03790 [Isosphaeraceae bacterium]|nr:hypothetical protein [Isosphaeraceae bacterium]